MQRISVSPHIHSRDNVASLMWTVVIALIPAFLASIYFFGPRAFWLSFVSVITAIITEVLTQLLLGRKVTIYDGSAVITGLLVAFNMPPGVPFYVPVTGTFFAIAIVKQLFGGLGYNIFNPALAGRVFVMFAWLPAMTSWNQPLTADWIQNFSIFKFNIDTITAATPLAVVKAQGLSELISQFGTRFELYKDLFIGRCGGCIGETSALALLIGAVVLFVRRVISWHIPISYIATVFVITFIAGQDPIFHILAGGLFLGAFFMATDYVTSPITKKGMIIYGIGCGLITTLLRLKGGLPEGVSFSILFMNALTPLIDRYVKRRVFGVKK